ncbi:MAG: YggT family protein [Candidatus Eiseniibacteriota bacterium]
MGLAQLIVTIANLLTLLILIDVIASWVPSLNRSELVAMVRRITDPILAPFRRLLPPQSLGIDVSPIGALLVIQLIVRILV